MMHPDIAMMNGRERVREILAEAEQRRLARQARKVARPPRGRAGRGPIMPGLPRLGKILPRGVRSS